MDPYVMDAPLTANEVLRLFHRDEPFLFLGAAFTTVALLCAAFSLLRRKVDALLLWLAAFAFLYGQRLWMDTNILGVTLEGKELFAQIRWIVSFLTPVPAFFFFQSAGLIPRRGRPFMYVLVFLFLGLAIATLMVGRLPLLHTINNVLVIAALPWLVLRTYLQGRVSRDFVVMRWGLLCFVLLALWDNTIGDLWRWRNIEPYGFAVFLCCLGYVAARRTLTRDQELGEIQKELELARTIQLSLLPGTCPSTDAFQIAARYVPMKSVAGDFYDVIAADARHVGLLIADVSGHGVPAALIASMVKMAAISQRDNAAHPAQLLSGMNRALCGNTQGQYVTAAYVFVDGEKRELRYAAAGHPSMLHLRNGIVTEVAENGLLLAAVDDIAYTEIAVPLEAGDRLLLYTDGMVEARNGAGKIFSEGSLIAALVETGELGPDEAADSIVGKVKGWAPSQDDDLTLLVCDYAG
ncbi:MAG TPA: PP2C family protein-serine/threonine phosphatase [Terracidiphilus sp.]